MSNRAIRRAAERMALKAAKREQRQQQSETQPQTMSATAAAAGESNDPVSPNPAFSSEDFAEDANDQPKRPVSDAQYAANRANAQKSHGPVTPEGKAKSCLNAVKTGLTGQTVLLPSDDAAAYQAHLDRHFKRHSPATDEEHTLVQMIADAEWRILRIPPLEESIYAIGRIKFADLHPQEKDPIARAALIKGEIFLAHRRDLSNLALQERRLRNQQQSDLEKLAALQKERAEKEKTTANQANKRVWDARNALYYARREGRLFNPADFGFEFTVEELDHFDSVVRSGKTGSNKPADALAIINAFRQTQKESQAA